MIEATNDRVHLRVQPSVHASAFAGWMATKALDNEARKAYLAAEFATCSTYAGLEVDHAARSTVVVVDDEPHIAVTLSEILLRHGYLAVWFTEPLIALALLQVYRPGLLLTDLTMPSCDGFDLAVAVKLRHPDCPVLMVTAIASSPKLAERIDTAGLAIALESKPLDVSRLLSRVAELTSLPIQTTPAGFSEASRELR